MPDPKSDVFPLASINVSPNSTAPALKLVPEYKTVAGDDGVVAVVD